jgi:hypothetical protein
MGLLQRLRPSSFARAMPRAYPIEPVDGGRERLP